VLGLPDKKRGERVAAAIVRSDDSLTERVLKDYLGEHLVDYQRPIDIAFFTQLPRNALGKILRRELRKRWADT
jgi:acyl-CoA synthetase (AMP-forming)/AMP-acid ligase II